MPTSSLLYTSPNSSIHILDLPTSLSSPLSRTPLSSPAPAAPYTVPTPRPTHRKHSSPPAPADASTHARLLPSILSALSHIREHYTGDFCLPRRVAELHSPVSDAGIGTGVGARELDFHANTQFLTPPDEDEGQEVLELRSGAGEEEGESSGNEFDDVSDLYCRVVENRGSEWATLTLRHPQPSKRFFIPPHSSFRLGPVPTTLPPSSTASYACSRSLPAGIAKPLHFLLLDPPWPNRSAVRKQKSPSSSAYKTSNRFTILPLLLSLPFGSSGALSDGALVVFWVTNKPATREAAKKCFAAWDCEEVAEWVWVKITARGECVFALQGPEVEGAGARRGYEVLLIGRKRERGVKKRKRSENDDEESVATDKEQMKKEENEEVREEGENVNEQSSSNTPPPPLPLPATKIIFAVPDFHSRKPCLKHLIEPYLPREYSALEVFARNLTEGWTAWGDEVLKWDWEGHLSKPPNEGERAEDDREAKDAVEEGNRVE